MVSNLTQFAGNTTLAITELQNLVSQTSFNVTTFGATGNGTTDDTAAINSAIAAFNTAGRGVLYFPTGTYKTTAALTTITANGIVQGDGDATANFGTGGNPTALAGTTVISTTTNQSCFTTQCVSLQFRNLNIENTASSTPTAGSAGITVLSPSADTGFNATCYESISVRKFYINIDSQSGSGWVAHAINIGSAVLYGMKVRNTAVGDSGDWSISDSTFNSFDFNTPAGFRMESSGGGKLSNIKFNGGGNRWFAKCFDIECGGTTADLFINNCSMENFNGTGIYINTSLPNVLINNCEFVGLGDCINLTNTSFITITNCVMGSATNFLTVNAGVSNVTVGRLIGVTGANLLAGVGSIDHDASGGIGGVIYGGGNATGAFYNITFTAPLSNQSGTLSVTSNSPTFQGFAQLNASNDASTKAYLMSGGSGWTFGDNSLQGQQFVASDGNLILLTNFLTGSTGYISLRAGGSGLANEVIRVQPYGAINFHQHVTPSSPVDGDMWYDGTNLKFRVGGTTKTIV